MKIAIRGGHNEKAQGASGIVNEVTEDRKIYTAVVKYLKLDKNTVLDVTPGPCESIVDLGFGVNKANAAKVDVFASIHLNASPNAKGSEVIYGSAKGKVFAERVNTNLAKLGFTNRGAKDDVRGLYEIKHTDMPAIIVECFFCDSPVDTIMYKNLGADKMGKAIAEGIVGHAINTPVAKAVVKPVVKPVTKPVEIPIVKPVPAQPVKTPVVNTVDANPAVLYTVQLGAFSVKANADALLLKAKASGFPDAVIK